MADWAWPHTPSSNWARVVLRGGPFDGEQVGFLPPDTTAPAQIAWAAYFPWGFASYLYEWHGETILERGRAAALVYRPPLRLYEDRPATRGRRLSPEEIPPLIGEDAEAADR